MMEVKLSDKVVDEIERLFRRLEKAPKKIVSSQRYRPMDPDEFRERVLFISVNPPMTSWHVRLLEWFDYTAYVEAVRAFHREHDWRPLMRHGLSRVEVIDWQGETIRKFMFHCGVSIVFGHAHSDDVPKINELFPPTVPVISLFDPDRDAYVVHETQERITPRESKPPVTRFQGWGTVLLLFVVAAFGMLAGIKLCGQLPLDVVRAWLGW